MATITQNGFTMFTKPEDFRTWLRTQKITRKITRLQVHHTFLPDYSNWAKDDPFRRQKNMKEYHINELGWDDIAQQLTIYPNGSVITGRNFNKTPIGIRGWNTNAVCVEIYGNFDKDKMTKEQQETVIAIYGIMCEEFKIKPSVATIRYHGWFTLNGTYLGGYYKDKSAKSCPGLHFFGGNTMSAMKSNFLPKIKAYIDGVEPNEWEHLSQYSRVLFLNNPIMKGEDVKDVQEKLKELKFYNSSIDGYFGPATDTAVKAYQKANKLVVDGRVGEKTWTSLFKEEEVKETIYYRVITGSYSQRQYAEAERDGLKKLGYDAFLVAETINNASVLRVVAVSEPNRKDADAIVKELEGKGYSPFITSYKVK